ncbi:MAG: hypothetical protein ACRD4E_08880 [Bryobacteraceae bacterium]
MPFEGLRTELPISEFESQRVRTHLDELLASRPFAGSRRRQAFLRYVVEETLAGRGSTIKEANIAVDVFGKGRDFDAQGGSLVRVTGGDVRKCLAQAYSSGLGQDLRIELPLGGYQPTFHFASQPIESPEPDPGPVTIKTLGKAIRPGTWIWIAVAVGFLIVAGISVRLLGMFATPSPLDLLWQPFLDKDRPVLVSLTAPTLLKLNPLHQSKWLPLDGEKSIPASELMVLRDSYVGTGGAMGAARFAEQLTSRQQRFDLKFGSDVNFGDLKNSPTILIGVSILTQRLTQGARFQLQMAAEGIKILDSKQKDRVWELPRRNYASPPRADGYSLITRLLHSDSGHPLLMIAGMDSHNTQAAVEFLTKNDLFRQFAQSGSSDWSTKNFQIVLHNTIYGNSAGSLKIVASEIW